MLQTAFGSQGYSLLFASLKRKGAEMNRILLGILLISAMSVANASVRGDMFAIATTRLVDFSTPGNIDRSMTDPETDFASEEDSYSFSHGFFGTDTIEARAFAQRDPQHLLGVLAS